MMNNNYTNFWNDIQVNTGVVDDDFCQTKSRPYRISRLS